MVEFKYNILSRITMDDIKQKAHYVAVTGIIRKDGKYLICKRSPNEKAFPNKWCVPGGKIELSDMNAIPKISDTHWSNVFENILQKEILEETKLKIKNIGYVANVAFIRPNGFSTLVISLHADHESGEVELNKEELTDHAWVSVDELKDYDLINNIDEQIIKVDKMYKK